MSWFKATASVPHCQKEPPVLTDDPVSTNFRKRLCVGSGVVLAFGNAVVDAGRLCPIAHKRIVVSAE